MFSLVQRLIDVYFYFSVTVDGTRTRLVHGPPVQGRDAAAVAEEDQVGGTADRGHGGLLHRTEHGAHVAQLHGRPVPLFLRSVGTAADGHVPSEQLASSVPERQVHTPRHLAGV